MAGVPDHSTGIGIDVVFMDPNHDNEPIAGGRARPAIRTSRTARAGESGRSP